MANRAYLQGLYHWANGDLAWASDNVKVAMCSSSYTPNTAAGADEFLNVIPGGAIVATSGNLASKTNVGGTVDAANPTISSVSGPSTITQFSIYNDTTVPSTSELIALYDTATNLPLIPNGGNITIQWAGSPNYVFTLCESLSEADRTLIRRLGWSNLLRFWHNLGVPADRRMQGGIWIPTPTLVQG